MKEAFLVLEDGSLFKGVSCGAEGTTIGEVVFSTSMTGYQEMLTDPSYAGQILTFTYPLIGNYGIHPHLDQSAKVQAAGCCMRSLAHHPSHCRSTMSLDQYLKKQGVVGIEGIDTRALTKKLREGGVQMGGITTEGSAKDLCAKILAVPRYESVNFVQEVSLPEATDFAEEGKWRVAVVDLGVKKAILEHLKGAGCKVRVFPYNSSSEELLAFQPNGILFSPGPGNPALLAEPAHCLRELLEVIQAKGKPTLFGICLGHQLLARCFGFETYKLKFGHRGANHPVYWKEQQHVTITAQNHGFAVQERSHPDIEITHTHVNDGTVEGLRHRALPIFSVQFHPEAAPGPLENSVLFEHFVQQMRSCA